MCDISISQGTSGLVVMSLRCRVRRLLRQERNAKSNTKAIVPMEIPALNPVLREMLRLGAAEDIAVTAVVTVVVTALDLLRLGLKTEMGEEAVRETLGLEDEMVEEAVREANCKVDVVEVCPVAVGIDIEELFTAAVLVLSSVDVLLLLSTVKSLAEHCPKYAQYCPRAQHIGPHEFSPDSLSQANDGAAAAAVVAVGAEFKIGGVETGVDVGG